MSLLIQDSTRWRGRAQLHGTRRGDAVIYAAGPKLKVWTWDSDKNPVIHALENNVYQASLNASDRLQAKKAELEASGRYTAAGIKDELRQFAEASVKPTLAKARAELDAAQKIVRERRANIKPIAEVATPDDAMTMMAKIEARTVLRGMSQREIVRVLAGTNPDPLFVKAALESAPHLVGSISPALRKHLETTAQEAKYGPELGILDDLEKAIDDAAQAATVVAADVTRELAGIAIVPPPGPSKREERRERAAFVDANGHEAYFNRDNGGTAA